MKLHEKELKILQDVLQRYEVLLNTNNFKTLYDTIYSELFNSIYGVSIGNITYVLMCANINPLDYMDEIPAQYFMNCNNLVSIDIPNGIKSVGDRAFEGCRSLISIIIPDGVTDIQDGAFAYCSELTNITIHDSVKHIDNYAFNQCAKLKQINYVGTIKQWNSILKDNNVDKIINQESSSLKGIPASCIVRCSDGDIDLNNN